MIPYDIKVLAFDLDGTLTQHKSPLSSEYKQLLTQLKTRYTLLMVGAGSWRPYIFSDAPLPN